MARFELANRVNTSPAARKAPRQPCQSNKPGPLIKIVTAWIKDKEMNMILRNSLAGLICTASIFGAGSAFGRAGDLDTTFGHCGVTLTSIGSALFFPESIRLQSDGKILVLVDNLNVGPEVLRHTASGVLDTTFGSNGVAVASLLSPSSNINLDLSPMARS